MPIYHLAFLLTFLTINAQVQVQKTAFHFGEGPALSSSAIGDPVSSDIIFQSTDGGQTWQDISAGLPSGFVVQRFFAGEDQLYVGAEKSIYRSSRARMAPDWNEDNSLNPQSTIVPAGESGVFAFRYSGGFFRKLNGTDFWMQEFTNFKERAIRTVYEAKDGAVFIGCDSGLFKSTDQGATWQQVIKYGWVMRVVESDEVMLCQSQGGILRSTDGGDHWEMVLHEGGVGIAVEVIEGGFAAINYNTESGTRRIRISTDRGTSWQPIDSGIPASMSIATINQVGKYFFCGHPDGIFRSSDQGKTWELLLSSYGQKVFNLFVSGNVIYAVAMDGGC